MTFRRDLLARYRGERIVLRLRSGTVVSGVLILATPSTVELGAVRAATAGGTWEDAAPGSHLIVDRPQVDYFQHVVTVVEPAPAVSA